MTPFFDDLPAEPEDEAAHPFPRLRTMPWEGPPPGGVAAVVPVEAVVARTAEVAIAVESLRVHPESFTVVLVAIASPERADRDAGLVAEIHDPFGHRTPPGDRLRIGVGFADGSKATNDPTFEVPGPPEDGIRLEHGGGGGSEMRMEHEAWVWPLPPDGPVTLAFAWRSQGIPESTIELDGAAIRAAASRAQVVFSDEHLPTEPPEDDDDGDGWTRYVPM